MPRSRSTASSSISSTSPQQRLPSSPCGRPSASAGASPYRGGASPCDAATLGASADGFIEGPHGLSAGSRRRGALPLPHRSGPPARSASSRRSGKGFPKVVFSTTLESVEGNARLARHSVPEQVRRLKEQVPPQTERYRRGRGGGARAAGALLLSRDLIARSPRPCSSLGVRLWLFVSRGRLKRERAAGPAAGRVFASRLGFRGRGATAV